MKKIRPQDKLVTEMFISRCIAILNVLTDDEKESVYNNNGLIGFIQDVASILNIKDWDKLDIQFVCDKILDSQEKFAV